MEFWEATVENMALRPAGFWKHRRVLVTGGAGFIGYALATRLAESGAKVYVLDIKPSLPTFELERGARKKISFIRGSVLSKPTVARILRERRIQTVFHLAAEAIVMRAHENTESALETNIKGTWVLLECARKARNIREIVVASSDKAYGSHDKLPYLEDAALQGLNPYDCSKSCTDLIAQMYGKAFGLPVTVARCGNVYGPGDTNWSRLIPDALRTVFRGTRLNIRSDGTYKRDYIFIDDVVDAYMTLGKYVGKKKLSGEAFNFGNNKPLRVMDVLKEISGVSPKFTYRILNTARNEIHDQYLDARKARRILKWRPRTSPHEGFHKTHAWYARYFATHQKA